MTEGCLQTSKGKDVVRWWRKSQHELAIKLECAEYTHLPQPISLLPRKNVTLTNPTFSVRPSITVSVSPSKKNMIVEKMTRAMLIMNKSIVSGCTDLLITRRNSCSRERESQREEEREGERKRAEQ